MPSLNRIIASLPKAFQMAVLKLYENPRAHKGDLFGAHNYASLNDIGKSVEFSADDLEKLSAYWLCSDVRACTIAAAAEFSTSSGRFKVRVGHFSAADAHYTIPRMLEGFDPKRTSLLMAGMSNRTTLKTLSDTCEGLSTRLLRLGFPFQLTWQMMDYPQFYYNEGEKVRVISDIGRGILGQCLESNFQRHIHVGLSADEMIMLSLNEQEYPEGRLPVYSLNVLTQKAGRIFVPLGDR